MNKNFIQLLDRINKIRKLYGLEEVEFATEPVNIKDLDTQIEEEKSREEKKDLINERIKNRYEIDIDEFKFALFTMRTVEFLPLEELINMKKDEIYKDSSKDIYLTIFNVYHIQEKENGILSNDIEELIVKKKYTLEEANEDFEELKKRIFTKEDKDIILSNVNAILDEQIKEIEQSL